VRRVLWAAPLVAVACQQLIGIHDFPDAGESDAAPVCLGKLEQFCLQPGHATEPNVLAVSGTIDTTSDPLCDAAFSNACVIAGKDVMVTANIVAIGTRPLVLLARDTITVTGTIDVSSHRAGRTGAGASAPGCAGTPPHSNAGAKAAGGGAGGSFGGRGGSGGGGTAAMGGIATAPIIPALVRGGCAGQDGGTPSGIRVGSGGASGGALYLVAGSTIDVGGVLLAQGAGGGGPASALTGDGGGGGGSGGLVALDAPAIHIAGMIYANGGGGAEGAESGSNGSLGAPGANGSDATSSGAQGSGGKGLSFYGGDGGSGSLGSDGQAGKGGGTGSAGSGTVGGGGGGGGGAGVVWCNTMPVVEGGAMLSPTVYVAL
jgi:hypothetical protein